MNHRAPSATGLRAGAAVLSTGVLLVFWLLGAAPAKTRVIVSVSPVGASVRLVEPRRNAEDKVAATGEVRFEGEGLYGGAKVRVAASAKGYRQALVEEVLPKEGGDHRISIRLVSETAFYTIRSNPAGAMIYFDGRAVGVAPAVVDEVVAGTHEVSGHLQGFEVAKLSVEASAGEHREIVLELSALPTVGDAGVPDDAGAAIPDGHARLVVTSTHVARFFYNNAVIGYGRTANAVVPEGRHRVTARAEGRGTKWEMVTIEDQGTYNVHFAFDEDPMERAFEATDPNKPLYWLIRGGNTRGEGKYGDAVAYFEKALELDPSPADRIELHRQLSRTHPALKNWDEAIRHTEKYLELSPEAPDAAFSRELLAEFRRRLVGERGE